MCFLTKYKTDNALNLKILTLVVSKEFIEYAREN